MRTENEIAESERLRTCWHEASHSVACSALGGHAQPRVWRNENRGEDETAWRGNCEIIILPKPLKSSPLSSYRPRIKNPLRVVGLAGFVGELLFYHHIPHELIYQEFCDRFYMSATDLEWAGDFGWRHVELTAKLLLANKESVLMEFEALEFETTLGASE